MPPKKKEEEKKIPLGRPGNNLKSGIVRRATGCLLRIVESSQELQVGLANVGKSTLFQAITKCSLGNPAVCFLLARPQAFPMSQSLSPYPLEFPLRYH